MWLHRGDLPSPLLSALMPWAVFSLAEQIQTTKKEQPREMRRGEVCSAASSSTKCLKAPTVSNQCSY